MKWKDLEMGSAPFLKVQMSDFILSEHHSLLSLALWLSWIISFYSMLSPKLGKLKCFEGSNLKTLALILIATMVRKTTVLPIWHLWKILCQEVTPCFPPALAVLPFWCIVINSSTVWEKEKILWLFITMSGTVFFSYSLWQIWKYLFVAATLTITLLQKCSKNQNSSKNKTNKNPQEMREGWKWEQF